MFPPDASVVSGNYGRTAIWRYDARIQGVRSIYTASHPPHTRYCYPTCPFPVYSNRNICLTAAGQHKIIALTNNYAKGTTIPESEREFLGWEDGATPKHLRELFDDFYDSSVLGMRFVQSQFKLTKIESCNQKTRTRILSYCVFTQWHQSRTGSVLG